VLGGTVVGTGNTDLKAGCYSFGRWIMIKHNNGLSTIYGHLSLIKVSIGQTVSTGDVIGLSGYSGYVYPPGPAGAHLHLGVYATAGVEIKQFIQSRGCKQVIVPIADTKAYLDPMLYLPIYNQ
jgi:murein DD-endopeptidase MepM/ murein hydrolase activator NlpD